MNASLRNVQHCTATLKIHSVTDAQAGMMFVQPEEGRGGNQRSVGRDRVRHPDFSLRVLLNFLAGRGLVTCMAGCRGDFEFRRIRQTKTFVCVFVICVSLVLKG